MAKIGLRNYLFGVLTEQQDGSGEYGSPLKPGKAVSCSVSVSNNSASLYADDGLAESDTSFQNATVSIEIDNEDIAIIATLLGHAIDDGEMVRSTTDIAPYVGLGRIITKMVNNVVKYKVEFLSKVKFGEPSADENTRGESVEFATTTLEGTASQLGNGEWSRAKEFDTLAAAQAYLEGLFGSQTAATVTYSANTGSNPPAAVTSYVGGFITLDDGSGLTAPSNKHFIGWDTTASATVPDYEGGAPFRVNAAAVTLYAIYAAN